MGCSNSKAEAAEDDFASLNDIRVNRRRRLRPTNGAKKRREGIASGMRTTKLVCPDSGSQDRTFPSSTDATADVIKPLTRQQSKLNTERNHNRAEQLRGQLFTSDDTPDVPLHPVSRFVPREVGGRYDRHYNGIYKETGKVLPVHHRVVEPLARKQLQVQELSSGHCASGRGLAWPILYLKHPVASETNRGIVDRCSMPPAGYEVDVVALERIVENEITPENKHIKLRCLQRLKLWVLNEIENQLRVPHFASRNATAVTTAAQLGVELCQEAMLQRLEVIFYQLAAIAHDYYLLCSQQREFMTCVLSSVAADFTAMAYGADAPLGHSSASDSGEESCPWRKMSVEFPSLRLGSAVSHRNSLHRTLFDTTSSRSNLSDSNPLTAASNTEGTEVAGSKLRWSKEASRSNQGIFPKFDASGVDSGTPTLSFDEEYMANCLQEYFMEDLVYCLWVASANVASFAEQVGAVEEPAEAKAEDFALWCSQRTSLATARPATLAISLKAASPTAPTR